MAANDVLATVLKSFGMDTLSTTDNSEESASDINETSDDEIDINDLDPHGYIAKVLQSTKPIVKMPTEPVEPPRKRKRRRGWKCTTRLPYTSSMFYRDYHNPKVQVSGHKDAKQFRLNYRMPWCEAHKIVELFVNNGWVFTASSNKKTYMQPDKLCPPEIKVLATLYWLGEGCSFRTVCNLSGRVLTRQTFTNFAKRFCKIVRTKLAPIWIRMPEDVGELRTVSTPYEKKGFPGACGSTDGVQIAWEGCPFAFRHSFTGKEKYPSLGFNVTVAHDMRIMYVCSMFAGRFNDKTKVLYDGYVFLLVVRTSPHPLLTLRYVNRLRSGYYHDFDYEVYDMNGNRRRCITPYLLCDNGYHRWSQLMCPYKTTSQEKLALWSKRLESIRKDVERTKLYFWGPQETFSCAQVTIVVS